MIDLTLLPCVFAVPDISEGREAFEEYVSILLNWKVASDIASVRTSVSDRTISLLFETGTYPVHPHVVAACRSFGIVEYSANDCTQVVNTLLSRAKPLEEATGIQDICHTGASFSPDIITQEIEQLREDIGRVLLIVAIIQEHCDSTRLNHVLAFKKLPQQCHEVTVDATIELMDPASINGHSPPFAVSQAIKVCENLTGFLTSLDPVVIWDASEDAAAIQLAVEIAWYKDRIQNGCIADWCSPPPIKIGTSFFRTVNDCGFHHNRTRIRTLIAAIVDLLVRRNLRKVHSLRTGPGGEDPPRMRGADRGMRRDLDREWHLHYWEMRGGVQELAAVVPHNCFDIPE